MSDRRPEDYDRDFAQMVSGLELGGADESPTPVSPPDLSGRTGRPEPGTRGEDGPGWFNLGESLDNAEVDDPDPSEWKPEPLPAARLSTPALVSLLLLGYCVVILLLIIFGAQPPVWVGWTAAGAFVASMLIGWRALPRTRDPGDGDGAVI